MDKNLRLVLFKQIFSYFSAIFRNILYIPFLTSLFFYLFIFFTLIMGSVLSNDIGVNFINSIIKTLFDMNILNDTMNNISLVHDTETTKKQFIFLIVGFGILYDLITRLILFFKKDFDEVIFQRKIWKLIKIFYIGSFIISSIIIIFVVKDWIWFILLLIILLMNAVSLGIAYSAEKGFRLIKESLK